MPKPLSESASSTVPRWTDPLPALEETNTSSICSGRVCSMARDPQAHCFLEKIELFGETMLTLSSSFRRSNDQFHSLHQSSTRHHLGKASPLAAQLSPPSSDDDDQDYLVDDIEVVPRPNLLLGLVLSSHGITIELQVPAMSN
ncbi:hypothetical protein Q3G72_014250 [Acer saccharum]|nr:hypothetical protein Q3G72_014250 [Acer saccharum]